jgi:hypothetical protein
MTLGVACNTEARVTKEVAEATILFLLEAVGIMQSDDDPINTARRNAIVQMLYTDAGQRQMVNWATNGHFPTTLNGVHPNIVFAPVNTYQHNQDALQMLFPHGPGTFSSYAANIRRLGYHALNGGTPQIICQRLFTAQTVAVANVNNVLDALALVYLGQAPNAGGRIRHAQGLQGLLIYLNNIQQAQIQVINDGNAQALILDYLSRLATHFGIHDAAHVTANQVRQELRGNVQILTCAYDLIIRQILSTANDVDTKLAIVLFVLDICDTADQVFDILDNRHAVANIAYYVRAVVNGQIVANAYNEYNHRPVSATSLPNTGRGDCVQTLYRHLVNIAIQNDNINPRNFNVGHLPSAMKHYYGTVHVANYAGTIQNPAGVPNVLAIPTRNGEAGITWLTNHQRWNVALSSSVPPGTDIINGIINNIVVVLRAISPHQGALINFGQSVLNMANRVYQNQALDLTIPSTHAQATSAIRIQDALNGLDGRCNNNVNSRRFIVSVTDNMLTPQVAAIHDQLPGINAVIEIADKLWNRRIIIGIWANGHAEIVSIQ